MSERAVVVYWGPGLSGKSTNLTVVRDVLNGCARGEGAGVGTARNIEWDPDRALIELGEVGEVGLQLELLAPPGQAHNRHLRREAFLDVAGVVFVADSSAGAVVANLTALEELELFVAAQHRELDELPLVFQYNKRDRSDALGVSRLDELLNPGGRPSIEAVATRGVGVFPSLKVVIRELRRGALQTGGGGVERSEEVGAVRERRARTRDAERKDAEPGGAPNSTPRSKLQWAWGRLRGSRIGWLLALAMLGGALSRELMELLWLFTRESR